MTKMSLMAVLLLPLTAFAASPKYILDDNDRLEMSFMTEDNTENLIEGINAFSGTAKISAEVIEGAISLSGTNTWTAPNTFSSTIIIGGTGAALIPTGNTGNRGINITTSGTGTFLINSRYPVTTTTSVTVEGSTDKGEVFVSGSNLFVRGLYDEANDEAGLSVYDGEWTWGNATTRQNFSLSISGDIFPVEETPSIWDDGDIPFWDGTWYGRAPSTWNGRSILNYVDPGADRLIFWDASANDLVSLALGSGLSISGTTLSVTTGTSGSVIPLLSGNNTWSGSNIFGTIVATNFSGSFSGTMSIVDGLTQINTGAGGEVRVQGAAMESIVLESAGNVDLQSNANYLAVQNTTVRVGSSMDFDNGALLITPSDFRTRLEEYDFETRLLNDVDLGELVFSVSRDDDSSYCKISPDSFSIVFPNRRLMLANGAPSVYSAAAYTQHSFTTSEETLDATPLALSTVYLKFPSEDNTGVRRFTIEATALATSGTLTTATNVYKITGAAQLSGGVLSLVGTPTKEQWESDASLDLNVEVNAGENKLDVIATGKAATVTWKIESTWMD